MRIIDEKGRLFGRINIIDFATIVFLLSLMPMVYFGYKISNNKPALPKYITEWHTVTVKFTGLIPEVALLIKEGDYEIDTTDPENKIVIAEVEKILESTATKSIVRIESGMYFRSESNPFQSDMVLTVKLLFTKTADGEIVYKKQPVRIGESLSFKAPNYIINGTILGTDWANDAFKDAQISEGRTRTIEVQFENIPPNVAVIVRASDFEKDITGQVLSEVEKIISNTPGEMILIDRDGIKFAENPHKNTMKVTFVIRCYEKNDAVFFKKIQLRVGDGFEFTTNKYRIIGIVTKI